VTELGWIRRDWIDVQKTVELCAALGVLRLIELKLRNLGLT
jgi:hypothetical protein